MQEKPQEEQEEKPKISKSDFGLMLSVALFFDLTLGLIQLIPFAGSIFAMVFNVVPLTLFYIWYTFKGVSFANKKNSVSFLGASLIEFIPVVNILPAWTAEITFMYLMQNKNSVISKAVNKVANVGVGVVGAVASAGLATETVALAKAGSATNVVKKTGGRSDSAPLQNPQTPIVGSEIRKPQQETASKPPNVSKFPIRRQEILDESRFVANNENVAHNENWIFGKDKAA